VGGNADSEGNLLLASQTEQWREVEAAVGIALPYAGVPPTNVTVFVGQFGHSEDSGRVLVASFCVLWCE